MGFGGLGIFGSFGFIENCERFVQDAPPGPGQGLERHLFRKLFVNRRQHLVAHLARSVQDQPLVWLTSLSGDVLLAELERLRPIPRTSDRR